MIETWHEEFYPEEFLSELSLDGLIERNKFDNERLVPQLRKQCIRCDKSTGEGLLLNDESYLCRQCLDQVSSIKYPEYYEYLLREYRSACQVRHEARSSFVNSSTDRKLTIVVLGAMIVSIPLIFLIHFAFLIVALALLFAYRAVAKEYESSLSEWDRAHPLALQPKLRHFHDPLAVLSQQDMILLKVFNNWPGYPPFWDYLRHVILNRDGNRCQVSGCPSRTELHIHHKIPTSQGGEHTPTNLVSLCRFHHGLEPDVGHEMIWGSIDTKYFTLVREHQRRNPRSPGYHFVHAHIRRPVLVGEYDLKQIIDYYGIACPTCSRQEIVVTIDAEHRRVEAECQHCYRSWEATRQLAEETGPRLAESLKITKNEGSWAARWDMLQTRADSTFKIMLRDSSKSKLPHKRIKRTEGGTPCCPKCGAVMRRIEPKAGDTWQAFWGCSNFRKTGCRGSINM